MAALPLGPQSAAGGVSLPDSFAGELQVHSAPHSLQPLKPLIVPPVSLMLGLEKLMSAVLAGDSTGSAQPASLGLSMAVQPVLPAGGGQPVLQEPQR